MSKLNMPKIDMAAVNKIRSHIQNSPAVLNAHEKMDGEIAKGYAFASATAGDNDLDGRYADLMNKATKAMNQTNESLCAKFEETEHQVKVLRTHLNELEQEFARIPAARFSESRSDLVGAQTIDDLEQEQSFAHLRAWNQGTARVSVKSDLKAALTSDGLGTMPSNPQRGDTVIPAQRPLTLLDVLSSRPVTGDAIEFVQLGTVGDAGYQLLQGDEKPELDLEGTLQRAEIATIAGFTAASRQTLNDNQSLASKVDQILRGKVREKLERELIAGAGGPGEINGLLNQGIAIAPTTATNDIDEVGEALSTMRSLGYNANVVVMNPTDYFRLAIEKDANGNYLNVIPALWNATVVQSSSIPAGQAIVMDPSYVSVLDRQALSIMVSNSHADFFRRNLIAILGELRAGLEVLDTKAVGLITFTPPTP